MKEQSRKDYWKGKPNKEKIILDLCGGTGSWSQPYKDAGYNVINITHPYYDVSSVDFLENYIMFKSDKKPNIIINIKDVYGILSAPTCTMFSLARTTAKIPRDLIGGFEVVQHCLNVIHFCVAKGKLMFWSLENPVGYLRQMLGKPILTFHPCDYGDGYTKKTDLWGYYNLPTKKPVALTPQEARDCSINNRMLPKIPEGYVVPEGFRKQQVRRSMTPQGFANQFYKANK